MVCIAVMGLKNTSVPATAFEPTVLLRYTAVRAADCEATDIPLEIIVFAAVLIIFAESEARNRDPFAKISMVLSLDDALELRGDDGEGREVERVALAFDRSAA